MSKNDVPIGQQIKNALIAASSDGLKRTQRWLALQIDMREDYLSNKLSGIMEFSDDELNKISEVLNIKFKKKAA